MTQLQTFPVDRNTIVSLSDEYWNLISPRDREEELQFPAAFAQASSNGHLSKELFVKVARWKSVRNTKLYRSNSEGSIHRATSIAFSTDDDFEAIKALIELRGVALRTASAVLHWMRPDRFPILDFRVLSALGLSSPRYYEDIYLYSDVADRVRELAQQYSLDLRTFDRALWAWDKRRTVSVRKCRR